MRRKRGEHGKKGHKVDFVVSPLLAVTFRNLALSAFVPFGSVSFSSDLLPPSSHFLPRPHLLAGVINDLTDTLDERCHESVKQVVIKTDAVSFRRGGERR